MSWVLQQNGKIVEWPGSARAGDLVGSGADAGIVIAEGDGVSSRTENSKVIKSAIDKGSRLGRGSLSFDDHFERHRDVLAKANGRTYPLGAQGQASFLADMSALIANRQMTLVGIGKLKIDTELVYVFRGRVGSAGLTIVMKPDGNWLTLLRSGEGLDNNIIFLQRFDVGTPHFIPGQSRPLQQQLLDEIGNLRRQLEMSTGDHSQQINIITSLDGLQKTFVGMMGYATNKLFNKEKEPDIMIWNNAFVGVARAQRLAAQNDILEASKEFVLARSHYLAALKTYLAWKDGIEFAGAKMQVAIGATAVLAIVALVAAFAAQGAIAGVATEQAFVRVAANIQGFETAVRVSGAEEQAFVMLEESFEQAARMVMKH